MSRKKSPTRRTNKSKKRVNQEFRRFKNQLKRWIDSTKLAWEGEPYTVGSVYKFVLDERLIQFILGLVIKSQDNDNNRTTIDVARAVKESLENGEVEDSEMEEAYEKFLTESGDGGTIVNDETEEVEETEGPGGLPEAPPDGP